MNLDSVILFQMDHKPQPPCEVKGGCSAVVKMSCQIISKKIFIDFAELIPPHPGNRCQAGGLSQESEPH